MLQTPHPDVDGQQVDWHDTVNYRGMMFTGVPNMVWYNYRRVPAVTLAKNLVAEGRLGRIFHYRANFLQDWTISSELPQGGAGLWRLDAAAAGSGVTGDLLAHCIDTLRQR